MFKRGDIVRVNWRGNKPAENAIVYEDRKSQVVLYPFSDERRHTVSGEIVELYTGPIYEKDGQRFVPSGEFRRALNGEWWLKWNTGDKDVHGPLISDDPGYKAPVPILLHVPELEEEFTFKVGDWVRIGKTDRCYQVAHIVYGNKFTWYRDSVNTERISYRSAALEKLPGRPLTTDDLMSVLSGKKVMMECHACGCKGVRGEIGTIKSNIDTPLFFFHANVTEHIAYFKNGTIVFAEGVEGNIFVVDE